MEHSELVLDNRRLREFGLMLGGGIIGIFGLLVPWFSHSPSQLWIWLLGAGFIALGLIVPQILKPAYLGWEKLGLGLGWINTRLILGVLFFCLITPLGMLMRVFGKGLSKHAYRVTKSARPAKHMEHPF